MAAPDYTKIVFRPGVHGTPSGNTGSIIGAINTAAVYVETDPNTRLANITFPASGPPVPYYGGGHVQNIATGNLTAARIALRNGMQPNAAAGPMQLQSTHEGDTMDAWVIGFVGGELTLEVIALNGTTTVTTENSWDEATDEYDGAIRVDLGEIPLGNVTASILGQTLGIVWATVVIGAQTRRGTMMCTVEWKIALAEAKNTAISAANRLTAPEDIGALTRATRWPGADEALTVPTGVLEGNATPEDGDSIAWCEEFTAIPNMFAARAGYHQCVVGAAGTPVP